MKLPGKQTDLFNQLKKLCFRIQKEYVLVIDPSIGSSSSQPGWALYKSGRLEEAGTLEIPSSLSLPEKCALLSDQISNFRIALNDQFLCVVEDIPAQFYTPGGGGGGRNVKSLVTLHKAMGVILGQLGHLPTILISPTMWKSRVRPTYIKSDKNDAIEMGYVVIELAKLMDTFLTTHRPRKSKRGK